MAYTLDEFAGDCRAALTEFPGPPGREKVRELLESALGDDAFVAAHLGPEADLPRNILYQDPDLGFCIVAHIYEGPRGSQPHDHGPSWAIYGQAKGVTEMTDWRLVEAPNGDRPGKVEAVRTYKLEPGQAKVYNVGDLHSPMRESETRLIRIEGQNLAKIDRDKFEAL
jgi:predicted metal-dependent enzyme (double-stranded beta helix superfamily)